ncbi:MFS transporter [Bailinhaonella thermotolerans]|uniref:MFS transporter n=1 Tax=Bailinhaonella thermotolerans TaxID=1070861 RepID=A0A3A4BFG1_9ACTN|nr:MFS transporter [Bailinhaonella thermotolerans]RJL33212.1 MFS transporter [Bailinhaonella thermotolerans]
MSESTAARPAILSRPLLLVFWGQFAAMTSAYLLLSTVPLYAEAGGAGAVGAGLATGALMFSTVVAEMFVPALVTRYGYRPVLAAGVLLLGVPALALLATRSLVPILVVSVVRGLGFAVVVVLGSALVAELAPPSRRGEALGLYGVVIGIPAVLALPAGVWVATHLGYPLVFAVAAGAALAALPAVPATPARSSGPEQVQGMLTALRDPGTARPALAFATTALAYGALVTFLPLATTPVIAPIALLAQAVATTFTRWWSGHHGDRHGQRRLLVPAIALAAAGVLLLAAAAHPAAALAGALLFGAGFGAAQNVSLSLMFESTPTPSTTSALWNIAFDIGIGLGGTAFGLLSTATGYPAAFALLAALILAMLLLVRPGAGTGARTGSD